MVLRRILVLFAVLAGCAGCGSCGASPAADPSPAATVTATPTPSASPTPGAAAVVRACDLVSAADVTAALHIGAQAGVEQDKGNSAACSFATDGGSPVIVRFYRGHATSDYDAALAGLGGEPVGGVGDRAFWSDRVKTAGVQKGEQYFYVQADFTAAPDPRSGSLALAQVILSRL